MAFVLGLILGFVILLIGVIVKMVMDIFISC
jgi:hypothetical protein